MEHDPEKLEALFASLDDEHDSRSRGAYLHPPINYMGTKVSQLDFILPLLPWHKTYVEVFGGSGAVLLAKKPSEFEVFNDRFAGSVALYRCLQSKELIAELARRIEMLPHSREMFVWCRDSWEKDTDLVDRAVKWYYTVQTSLSGKCRFFGRSTIGPNNTNNKITNGVPLFHDIHQRLKKVLIENLDWRHCFTDFDHPDTLFYLDPPYYGNDGYGTGFTKQHHIELCERIFQLEGSVVLSGYENPIYDEFPWDGVHVNYEVDNRFTPAVSEGTKRAARCEYLWIKESSDG
jgi:DNA adenine methylase